MKKFSGIATALMMAAGMLLLGVAVPASAQATRTWVSGVGDDVNPCSRTAPCKTFAGAISKTAMGGEINCIDPGGFGAVTITKSITIDCVGVLAGVLVAGANGIIVNAPNTLGPDTVVLRNLDINGTGTGLNGIRVISAANVHVENVTIYQFSGNGIDFRPTSASKLFINNVSSRHNTTHGIYSLPSPGLTTRVLVSNSRLNQNGLTGIRIDDGSATVSDSVLQGNGTHGASAVGTGKIFLERVVTAGNANGGVLANGAGAVVWMSNITSTNNDLGMAVPVNGGQLISFGNNHAANNTSGVGGPATTVGGF